ncbi:alginate O-acetyltransferase AlgX-related protein [Pseudoprimorskyibacter insulae]|uniref:Alginate biosynthesis protein AlgX n=1 Tax=Pseudoprimorskyibacter insulae TaxID=1695997 RepID=A0A2R8APL8_9RHOB|nr:hypothetical protein [Pseudoprimorskyibacter insulae]SPF77991.1 Alginate biosynthesis protein AlgX [Pseudoprimorskyibacter insulae]
MKRLAKGLAAAAVAFAMAQTASAQSTYGCTDLDGFHKLPSVEGTEGFFFRVEPELYNHHPFSDETVEDLARVAQSLAQSGTTLIYAPIPPKSMVMTKNLPQRAFDYGFDPDIASTLYDDMIERLQAVGVRAVNLRRALVVGAAQYGAPYFKADFRLNTLGARIVAQAVAQEMQQTGGGFGAPRAAFNSVAQGKIEIDSDMRRILQRHCLIELPRTEVDAFATARAGGGNGNFGTTSGFSGGVNTGNGGTANTGFNNGGFNQGNQGFNQGNGGFNQGNPGGFTQAGNANQGGNFNTGVFNNAPAQTGGGFGQFAQVALVGTEYTADPKLNFAGFLSESTGFAVNNLSIPGGGAFGAMSAFLTSDSYQQARPGFLVWENPVYYNLAKYGDQPMRELMAAGGAGCRLPVPVMGSMDANSIRADLSGLDPMQDYTLMLDTGGSNASLAQFVFTSSTGATRTKSVSRRTEQEKTGRFYVPISGLWSDGVRSLEVRLNAPMNGTPRITACFY